MGRIGRTIALVVILAGTASPGVSQWLRYPTEGIPRKADGKPDLAAPTPRLPDGKPDLSGIWHARQSFPCMNSRGEVRECGAEIGGARLGSTPATGHCGGDRAAL